MSDDNPTKSNMAGWTPTQGYVMAVVCLLIGIAGGYLTRGSSSPMATAPVPNAQPFASEKELAKLAAEWPGSRLAEIWNSFAGVAPFSELKPVKKFKDRKSAVARIWAAVQRRPADGAPQARDVG